MTTEPVHHPDHYGGKGNPYEAIKVIEAWGVGFNVGSALKYISRAGKKSDDSGVVDYQKACWYLLRELANAEGRATNYYNDLVDMARKLPALADVINALPASTEVETEEDRLLDAAWGVIANVSKGNWDEQPAGWTEAAGRWRDQYHAWLKKVPPVSKEITISGRPVEIQPLEEFRVRIERPFSVRGYLKEREVWEGKDLLEGAGKDLFSGAPLEGRLIKKDTLAKALKSRGIDPGDDPGDAVEAALREIDRQRDMIRGTLEQRRVEQTEHQRRVEAMMYAFGQKVPGKPTVPDPDTRVLRARLILEEALETIERGLGVVVRLAWSDGNVSCLHHIGEAFFEKLQFDPKNDVDMVELADGCADLSVVTVGTLSACGIKDKALLEEVDQNNLLKATGGHRDEHGKFVKPEGHPAPNVAGVLYAQSMSPVGPAVEPDGPVAHKRMFCKTCGSNNVSAFGAPGTPDGTLGHTKCYDCGVTGTVSEAIRETQDTRDD